MGRFLIFLLAFHAVQAMAQPLGKVTFTVSDNLPGNFTKTVIQDQDGLIWIGTDAGLARFDGIQMVPVTRDLPSLLIKYLLLQPDGSLLVLTDRGLSRISRRGYSWITELVIGGSETATDSTLHFPKTMYRDRKGILWLGESDAIVSWDGKQLTRYPQDKKFHNDSFIRSFAFFEDDSGHLWAASWGGFLLVFHPETKRFREIPTGIDEPVHRFYSVVQIQPGRFWLGTKFGTFELLAREGSVKQIRRISDLKGINSFYRDEDGTVFAGTLAMGVYKTVISDHDPVFTKISQAGDAAVNQIRKDREGKWWVCTDEGVQLLYPQFFSLYFGSDKNLIFRSVSSGSFGSVLITEFKNLYRVRNGRLDLPPEKIQLPKDKDLYDAAELGDTLWVSFRDGELIRKTGSATVTLLPVNENRRLGLLLAARNGVLWGRDENGKKVFRIDPDGGIQSFGTSEGILSSVNGIRELSDGSVWLAGSGQKTSLYRWDESTQAFSNISPALKTDFQGVLEVYDLEKGPDGVLYLATNDGLYRVTGQTAEKWYPDQKDRQMVVRTLRMTDRGWMLAGTEKGLSVFTGSEWIEFAGFSGATNSPMIMHGLIPLDSGRVFIVTPRHLIAGRLPVAFPETLPPLVTALSVNGTDNPEDIFAGSSIEIRFQAPVFPSEPVNYQYQIAGHHGNWVQLGTQNTIHLSGLEEGIHRVEFRAQKAGAAWSKSRVSDLKVVTPFYLTVWAKLVYLLLLTAGFWITVQQITAIRTKKLQKRQQDLEFLVSVRTHELEEEKKKTEAAYRDLKEKELLLETSLHELTAANQLKTDLIGMASHELRNPLQAVLGNIELLRKTTLPEKEASRLEKISQAASRMLTLVSHLLDSARVESGQYALRFSHPDFAGLIRSVIQAASDQTERKNQTVSLILPPGDYTLDADENALREITENLLSNSIKYSPAGSEISVELSGNSETIQVVFRDQGPGLTAADLDQLFLRFRKLSAKPTAGELSSGLGLYIAKELTERHTGKIWAESEPGKGAAFFLQLPKTQPPASC